MIDITESVILDSWKRQGGVYKQAAEFYEKVSKLRQQAKVDSEQEERDATERPVTQARVDKLPPQWEDLGPEVANEISDWFDRCDSKERGE